MATMKAQLDAAQQAAASSQNQNASIGPPHARRHRASISDEEKVRWRGQPSPNNAQTNLPHATLSKCTQYPKPPCALLDEVVRLRLAQI